MVREQSVTEHRPLPLDFTSSQLPFRPLFLMSRINAPQGLDWPILSVLILLSFVRSVAERVQACQEKQQLCGEEDANGCTRQEERET